MTQQGERLTVGETGPYAPLATRPLGDGLVLLFIPSLAALVTRAEQLKGSPLSREELLRIRDNASVVVCESEQVRAVEEQRGYEDLAHADPWGSWLVLRGRSE